MEREKVFVYGTLRPPRDGSPARDTRYFPRIRRYVRRVTPAVLREADLFDMGTFPAARPGAGTVIGDLLEVTPAAVRLMDEIEGDPYFYNRKIVEVETDAGTEEAWIYWAPDGLESSGFAIPNGDWLNRTGLKTRQPADMYPVRTSAEL